MPTSVLNALPRAVLVGLALGGLFAVLSTVLFVVGERWFPSTRATGTSYAGEDRRRAEIREYLREIGERFVEGHPVAGHSVAFYLPERDVAVTFDAQAYFRIRSATGTYVILCEHEMPGRHLGARLPFEVPEPETRPSAGDLTDAVARAYDALGLPSSASADEVRAAYRERVKEVHPDHGGDEADFRRVREAYVTAREDAD